MDIELQHYLKEVEESSKRARQIFLILVFATLSIFIAFVNALPQSLNWFESRAENFRNAEKYFYFSGDIIEQNDKALMANDSLVEIRSLKVFIDINELKFVKDSSAVKIWLSNNKEYLNNEGILFKHPLIVSKYDSGIFSFDLKIRSEAYSKILSSLKNILRNSLIHRNAYNAKIQAISDEEFDKIMFVHVPILGLSFDINNLGLFSGLLISILYWLLYAALQREHVNTKIAFRKGWEEIIEDQREAKLHQQKTLQTGIIEPESIKDRILHPFNFYEFISMKQVLNMPQKLFAPSKRRRFNSIGKIALYFPMLAFSLVVFSDGIPTLSAGLLTNSKLTVISLSIEVTLLIICFLALFAVIGQWKKMNNLWNFQALSYNFEFILECIGEDSPCDLMEFAENILLSKSNKEDIKKTWYYYWKSNQAPSQIRFRRFSNSRKTFEDFIDDSLKATFRGNLLTNIDNRECDVVWEALKTWHKEDGSLNIKDNFEESLYIKVFHFQKNKFF